MRPSGGNGWRIGALVCGAVLAGGLIAYAPRDPVRAASDRGDRFSYSEPVVSHTTPRPPLATSHDGNQALPVSDAPRPPHRPPPPQAPPGPGAQAPAPPDGTPRRTTWVELIGIASSGQQQTAVVRIGGRTMQLRVGSIIGSWKVAALDCRPLGDSSMVVTRGSVRRQLRLVSRPPDHEEAGPPPAAPSSPEGPPVVSSLPHGAPTPLAANSKRPVKGPMAGMATPFPGEPPDAPHPVDPRDFNP